MSEEQWLETKRATYRNSTLSTALLDELQARVDAGELNNDMASQILAEYDKIFEQQLELLAKQNHPIEAKLTGRVDMYRVTRMHADLELSDVEIRYTKPSINDRILNTDQVFIRACNLEKPQTGPRS